MSRVHSGGWGNAAWGLALACCLGLAGSSWAGPFSADNAGTSAVSFLKIPVGTRSVGMASAYTAVASGPESLWWNPAGLLGGAGHELLLESVNYQEDFLLNTVAVQIPLGEGDAVGMMVNRLGFNLPMPGYDGNGLPIGEVQFSDMAFVAGYATTALEVPFGINLKVISSTLEYVSGLAVAGDIGVRQDFFKKDLTVALSLRNVGTKIQYEEEAYPLPFTLQAGAVYRLLNGDLLLAADVQAPYDQAPHYHLGVELSRSLGLAFQIALRAGYTTHYPSGTDALNGLNAGLGLSYRIYHRVLARSGRMTGYKDKLVMLIGLDYAWTPNDQLAASHRIALRFGF